MGLRDWQNHPVVMLGGAFTAGLALALTVAIPLYSTSIQNASEEKLRSIEEKYAKEKSEIQAAASLKLRSIQEEYEKDKAGIAEAKSLREQNALLREQAASALVQLYQVSKDKPFSNGNVVPLGFEALKVGNSITDLYALFPKRDVSSSGGFYYVELRKGFFDTIQVDAPKGVILDVNYYVRDTPADRAKLHAAVTAAFGKHSDASTSERGDGTFYTWKVGKREIGVYGDQYSIRK